MSWTEFDDVRRRNIPRALRYQADRVGDRPFLVFEDATYSYAEVDALSNSYANGLADLGLRQNDAICMFAPSCRELALVAFAANKLGAFWVPVNKDLRGDFLLDQLTRSSARVLLLDAALADRVEPIWSSLRFSTVIVRGDVNAVNLPGAEIVDATALEHGQKAFDVGIEPGYNSLASVIWTSGTTGPSKGVMQSHHAWIYQSIAYDRRRQVMPGEVIYNCLPLYNSGAWVLGVFGALVCGAAVACDPHFSVSRFWDRVRLFNAQHTATIGAMHIFLWQRPATDRDADNPLRGMWALPMPAELEQPFKARFGIELLAHGSGQSEVMGFSFTDPTGRRRHSRGSAGFMREDMEYKIADQDDMEAPADTPGELCVRSRVPYTLFLGYFNDPAATVAAFRDLWYHTGDVFKRNDRGELFFVDRAKDFVRYKGRSVSSFEVEQAISKHPAVAEVAVVGAASAELASEEELLAFVILKEGQSVAAAEIATFVNTTAPYYFVPRYIAFVTEMPHNGTGRIEKYKLRTLGVPPGAWDQRDSIDFTLKK